MATGWRKFPRQKVLKAIKDSGGVKLLICQRLGCDRGTLDRYLANDPIIRKAYEDEQEELCDVVESKIIQRIKEGCDSMIMFFAKTKMKHRGYVERQEMENTQPVVIHIDEDDARG
ncbi:hypothetical protein [uncultured Victivallis sp.]|uniref:hypothetical protein n=1 Tax=uncultured Victivallis sp. TaxID=354118 RepID=UPI002598B598|nr:hypothetical protein [uncultured Victivallis sp.]